MRKVVILLITCESYLFCGCSNDSVPEYARQQTEVALAAHSSSFVETPASTRAVSWPSGYYDYDDVEVNGSYLLQGDMMTSKVGAFFTRSATGSGLESASNYAVFDYRENEHRWRSSLTLAGGRYYLYGFLPSDLMQDQSIISSDYSQGATLTLRGMSTLSAADPCIVVGAKEGTGSETVTGLTTGQFAVSINDDGPNYLFLLFDHLFAAIRISFKVDADYAELRTIKLRQLAVSSTGTARTDALVQLTATNGTSPIASVTYSNDSGSDNSVTIFNGEEPLTTSPSLFRVCFVPSAISQLVLHTTYDVYDKKGNLIRENRTALNTIASDTFEGLSRGRMLSVNLTVQPTYQYVLSDDDLDNPKIID